ncbi:hypothetical protein J5N97_018897 [Dioscorea zingiberensis]|uniref:Uncharacterized protein n=1 Tax=Dioscorea zingiberensis TaxID=325984 RepID=A0A9D5HCC7_9LILI|nr:hypothetical protein J5N97_018897 [Dioscorea zingiberensis]
MSSFSILSLALAFALAFALSLASSPSVYIIQTYNRPAPYSSQIEWYESLLNSVGKNHPILHMYDVVMQGFATSLTTEEAEVLSKLQGVIGVYKESTLQYHTTHSPAFLGLTPDYGVWPESNFGEDVIIGVVDTGVWPESPSFNDDGLHPVSSAWRGSCENGTFFSSSLCNNKLVGARYIKSNGGNQSSKIPSPRDEDGHGTHTASTAAGSMVRNATLLGFAKGTSAGMAPKAKVAMYKVDFTTEPMVVDAMNAAVKDGVHILSLSLGHSPEPSSYYYPVAIGAFSADREGVFVTCSAGNGGPFESSVINTAPWVTTVGASTLDRHFPAHIVLGDGSFYTGESIYDGTPNETLSLSLIYIESCYDLASQSKIIAGKAVLCLSAGESVAIEVQQSGGAALISINNLVEGEIITVAPFSLPALTLGYLEGKKILAYINSTANPTVKLVFPMETVIASTPAPAIAGFSSRGPGIIVPQVLKPDITAPGVNILAAWPTDIPFSSKPMDPRRSPFNVISGTSMSAPHVAGVAALIRNAHPQWSPAMIRSALITTAMSHDNRDREIVDQNLVIATPFAVGAGHVHPQSALDPGLVYDARSQDYINFLCTIGYTHDMILRIVQAPYNCSKLDGGPGGLNYPSMVVIFNPEMEMHALKRVVTKVSDHPETYKVRVSNPYPEKVQITVEPKTLVMNDVNETAQFTVFFRNMLFNTSHQQQQQKPPQPGRSAYSYQMFGSLIWESSTHGVKSPIAVLWKH